MHDKCNISFSNLQRTRVLADVPCKRLKFGPPHTKDSEGQANLSTQIHHVLGSQEIKIRDTIQFIARLRAKILSIPELGPPRSPSPQSRRGCRIDIQLPTTFHIGDNLGRSLQILIGSHSANTSTQGPHVMPCLVLQTVPGPCLIRSPMSHSVTIAELGPGTK